MLAVDRAAVDGQGAQHGDLTQPHIFGGRAVGHAGEGSSHPLHENNRTPASSGRRQQGHDGGRGLGRCIERAVDHGKESVVALANACLCGHHNEGRVGSASCATADGAKKWREEKFIACEGELRGRTKWREPATPTHTTRGRTATDRGTRAHATLSPGHVHVLSSPRPSVRSGMGRSACRGGKKAGQVGGATVWAARVLLSRPTTVIARWRVHASAAPPQVERGVGGP